MSAGLTVRENGFVEMAYLKSEGVPWHNSGNPMADGESKERWIDQSGFGVKINRSRVRYGEPPNQRIFDDHHVLFRSDTKEPLAVVGKGFQIVQPTELFEPVWELCERKGYKLSAAGTLFGGKRYWVACSVGGAESVIGGDVLKGYLMGVTAVDGSLKTIYKRCATRPICNNTVNAALAEGGAEFRKSHRSVFDAGEMLQALGLARNSFEQFVAEARRLSLITMNTKEAQEMTASLLTESKTVTKEDVTASTGYKTILQLFDHGKGNHGETAWDWLNGVTEYVDHFQRAKTESHRMNNTLLGKGDALKSLALQRAMALAD